MKHDREETRMKEEEKIKSELTVLGERAKKAAAKMALIGTKKKNSILTKMAQQLRNNTKTILASNLLDVKAAKEKNATSAFIDRLTLTEGRIEDMAKGLESLVALKDPVGEVIHGHSGEQEIEITKVRVPIGVIGIIYEARPNVTADAAGICFKTGNAVILRGSGEAKNSNRAIVDALVKAVEEEKGPAYAIQLVDDTSRESAVILMQMNQHLDLLIPRGGAELIKTVIKEATIPVIETGIGNCHIYVDAGADIKMAEEILINAKTQRPGVCNAVESLLVHKDIAKEFVPVAGKVLQKHSVELRACPEAIKLLDGAKAACEDDFATEFLDLVISIKIVDSIESAIEHINKYGSKHSEAIISNDRAASRRFTKEVDAAVVYINASTRFTDGGMFGFGAEIGISTQKLHARGPMGLDEMTTYKYIVQGEGQIRK